MQDFTGKGILKLVGKLKHITSHEKTTGSHYKMGVVDLDQNFNDGFLKKILKLGLVEKMYF